MNQNFCSVLLKQSCLNLQKLFHSSGTQLGNHYETLKIQRNCTSKQIRDSFIKLSKVNHPDVNKDPKAHKKFLKIQEAYNVLSKPASRTSYDLSLSKPYYSNDSGSANVRSTRPERHEERGKDPWDDPSIYHNGRRSRTYNEDHPYYGVKGINKVSNETVALIVVVIAMVAFFGQMIAIKDKMMQKSRETQETLNEIQERANRNGKELQIEILRRHFEEAERQREKLREGAD